MEHTSLGAPFEPVSDPLIRLSHHPVKQLSILIV